MGLENVLEPLDVPSAILHGLGLREEDRRSAQSCLAEHLDRRHGLLVLDNFEQIAEAAPLLAELLMSCARLKILITSRAMLHLRAEREYAVPALISGDEQAAPQDVLAMPAVALFLDRAQAVMPTPETARVIAEICARLDGVPLAIELAAARTKLLSPKAILGRLRNRFQLLSGGARDLPERQRTLRHAIDWSYDLLGHTEQVLLQCLAVFSGGATVEAVEAVCGGPDLDTLELLTSLVDKNLVIQEKDRAQNARIRMLETIREYARERLEEQGGAPLIHARHAAYYLDLAEDLGGNENDGSPAERYDLLEADHSNCRAALEFLLRAGQPEQRLRMPIALWPFWEARGYWTEGREQLRRALSASAHSDLRWERAKALYGAGVLADAQGDYAAARIAFEEHLALQRGSPDQRALAAAINNLGVVALRQRDYDAATAAYLETLEILRALDSQRAIAQCLNNLGHVALGKGDYAAARANYGESLAIGRRLRSTLDVAWTLSNLGDLAQEESNFKEAQSLYSQSFALFREIKDQPGIASCMSDLGNLAIVRGEYSVAAQLLQESMCIFGELGDKRGIARVLEGFAGLASAHGRAEAALRLAAAATAVRRSLGVLPSQANRKQLESGVAAMRIALGAQAERVWAEGGRMSLEKAIQYALASAEL